MSDDEQVHACPRCGFPETRKQRAQQGHHVQGGPECTACLNSGQFWFIPSDLAGSSSAQPLSTSKQQPSQPQQQVESSFQPRTSTSEEITPQVPQELFTQSSPLVRRQFLSPSTDFQGAMKSLPTAGQSSAFVCDRCYFFQSLEDYNGPHRHIKYSPECDDVLAHFSQFLHAHPEMATASHPLSMPTQGVSTSVPASASMIAGLSPAPQVPQMTSQALRRHEQVSTDSLAEGRRRVIGAHAELISSSPISLPSPSGLAQASRSPQVNIPQQAMPTIGAPSQALSGPMQQVGGQRVNVGLAGPSSLAVSPNLGEIIYNETIKMAELVPKARRENATVLPYGVQSDMLAALHVFRDQPTSLIQNLLRAHHMGGNVERNVKTVADFLRQPFKDAFPANQNAKNVQKAAHRMITSIEYLINIWKLRHELDRGRTSAPRLY